jgi:hypothetical protein
MSKPHTFSVKAKCGSCGGTGLYVGLGERDGSAVVCHTCKGTGCQTLTLTWDDFTGRVDRPEVRRVVQANPGICVGTGNGHALADFGGMPADAWRRGEPFPAGSEMRRFTCPAWWYQSADYKKKPDWKECGYGAFSACDHFKNKAACWERFDREQATRGQA